MSDARADAETASLVATGAFRVIPGDGYGERWTHEREAACPFRSASCLTAGDLILWPFHRTWDGSDSPLLHLAIVRDVREDGMGAVRLALAWIKGGVVPDFTPSTTVDADTAFRIEP